jgi:DNA-binding transcriptional MerR regulator
MSRDLMKKMAKTKRTTQAEPVSNRPTMAGLQAQIDELASQALASHNDTSLAIESIQAVVSAFEKQLANSVGDLKTRLDVARGIDVHHAEVIDEIKAKLAQQEIEIQAKLDDMSGNLLGRLKDKITQLETQLAQSIAGQGKIVFDQAKLAGDLGLQINDLRNSLAGVDSKSLHSAKLQDHVNDELKAKISQIETELHSKLDLLGKSIEKFGGENGQIAQALAEIKSAKHGGGWLNWVPVGVISIAIAIFLGVQRGCSYGSPKPAPDEFEQSIIEPSKAKKLAGSVIMLIDRDPMTDEVLKLETAAEAYKLGHEGFEFRSFDYQDDKSAKVVNYIAKAKEKGVDPPCMIHLLDGKVSFAPAAKDWAGVVNAFGK